MYMLHEMLLTDIKSLIPLGRGFFPTTVLTIKQLLWIWSGNCCIYTF